MWYNNKIVLLQMVGGCVLLVKIWGRIYGRVIATLFGLKYATLYGQTKPQFKVPFHETMSTLVFMGGCIHRIDETKGQVFRVRPSFAGRVMFRRLIRLKKVLLCIPSIFAAAVRL